MRINAENLMRAILADSPNVEAMEAELGFDEVLLAWDMAEKHWTSPEVPVMSRSVQKRLAIQRAPR